jgi:hypothetical protein
MVKVYYNKIVKKNSTYTVADINSVSMQRNVVAYAKSQVIAGKLTQDVYDELFAPYEGI